MGQLSRTLATSKMFLLKIATLVALLSLVEAKGNYWWMEDTDSVFGAGSNNGAASKPIKKQQNFGNFPAKVQQKPANNQNQGGYNNPKPAQQPSQIMSECPAGTKCVQEYFCDENAVMVSYRVSLTKAQKQKRGSLPQCINGNDGKLDVCCSTAPIGGGGANIPIRQQQQQQTNNQQGALPDNQVDLVQPVSVPSNNNNENAIPIPTGSCPTIDTLPSIEVCQGKNSTCWSVDQPDVDCENNALCCFDGCINACYFDGDNPPPQTTPAPAAIPAQQPVPPANQQTQQQAGGGGGGVPQNSYVPPPAPAPRPQRTQRPKPKPVPVQTFVQNSGSAGGTRQDDAASKPFVMCPSAMLCIPRANCDFKGFITEQTIAYSPQLEMLSVPLIPCVNPENQNIDVCCRDPNYVDPWQAMIQAKNNGNQQPQQDGGNIGINPRINDQQPANQNQALRRKNMNRWRK